MQCESSSFQANKPLPSTFQRPFKPHKYTQASACSTHDGAPRKDTRPTSTDQPTLARHGLRLHCHVCSPTGPVSHKSSRNLAEMRHVSSSLWQFTVLIPYCWWMVVVNRPHQYIFFFACCFLHINLSLTKKMKNTHQTILSYSETCISKRVKLRFHMFQTCYSHSSQLDCVFQTYGICKAHGHSWHDR